MNPIEALQAVGLNPVIVDEDTDINLKLMTNTKFVEYLMNWCPHGALVQSFIIEAIRRYAKDCSEHRLPEDFFINPDAWQGIAKWIKQEMEKKYG